MAGAEEDAGLLSALLGCCCGAADLGEELYKDWDSHPACQQYQILRRLGEGGFSEVHLAQDRLTGKAVALKVVFLNKGGLTKEQRKILAGESRLVRMVAHPHVVRCMQVLETRRQQVLVLEHLSGGEMLRQLQRMRRYSEANACRMFKQIVDAVAYLHSLGILHRDIKPENCLLAKPASHYAAKGKPVKVKLIDLGMAGLYRPSRPMQGCMGSPGFIAPEVILGEPHTPSMDVYSLGVLLFVMLVGRKPWDAQRSHTLAYAAQRTCEAPGLQDPVFATQLSAPAKQLLVWMLCEEPSRRPTAQQVLGHTWVLQGGVCKVDDGSSSSSTASTAHQPSQQHGYQQVVQQRLQVLARSRDIMGTARGMMVLHGRGSRSQAVMFHRAVKAARLQLQQQAAALAAAAGQHTGAAAGVTPHSSAPGNQQQQQQRAVGVASTTAAPAPAAAAAAPAGLGSLVAAGGVLADSNSSDTSGSSRAVTTTLDTAAGADRAAGAATGAAAGAVLSRSSAPVLLASQALVGAAGGGLCVGGPAQAAAAGRVLARPASYNSVFAAGANGSEEQLSASRRQRGVTVGQLAREDLNKRHSLLFGALQQQQQVHQQPPQQPPPKQQGVLGGGRNRQHTASAGGAPPVNNTASAHKGSSAVAAARGAVGACPITISMSQLATVDLLERGMSAPNTDVAIFSPPAAGGGNGRVAVGRSRRLDWAVSVSPGALALLDADDQLCLLNCYQGGTSADEEFFYGGGGDDGSTLLSWGRRGAADMAASFRERYMHVRPIARSLARLSQSLSRSLGRARTGSGPLLLSPSQSHGSRYLEAAAAAAATTTHAEAAAAAAAASSGSGGPATAAAVRAASAARAAAQPAAGEDAIALAIAASGSIDGALAAAAAAAAATPCRQASHAAAAAQRHQHHHHHHQHYQQARRSSHECGVSTVVGRPSEEHSSTSVGLGGLLGLPGTTNATQQSFDSCSGLTQHMAWEMSMDAFSAHSSMRCSISDAAALQQQQQQLQQAQQGAGFHDEDHPQQWHRQQPQQLATAAAAVEVPPSWLPLADPAAAPCSLARISVSAFANDAGAAAAAAAVLEGINDRDGTNSLTAAAAQHNHHRHSSNTHSHASGSNGNSSDSNIAAAGVLRSPRGRAAATAAAARAEEEGIGLPNGLWLQQSQSVKSNTVSAALQLLAAGSGAAAGWHGEAEGLSAAGSTAGLMLLTAGSSTTLLSGPQSPTLSRQGDSAVLMGAVATPEHGPAGTLPPDASSMQAAAAAADGAGTSAGAVDLSRSAPAAGGRAASPVVHTRDISVMSWLEVLGTTAAAAAAPLQGHASTAAAAAGGSAATASHAAADVSASSSQHEAAGSVSSRAVSVPVAAAHAHRGRRNNGHSSSSSKDAPSDSERGAAQLQLQHQDSMPSPTTAAAAAAAAGVDGHSLLSPLEHAPSAAASSVEQESFYVGSFWAPVGLVAAAHMGGRSSSRRPEPPPLHQHQQEQPAAPAGRHQQHHQQQQQGRGQLARSTSSLLGRLDSLPEALSTEVEPTEGLLEGCLPGASSTGEEDGGASCWEEGHRYRRLQVLQQDADGAAAVLVRVHSAACAAAADECGGSSICGTAASFRMYDNSSSSSSSSSRRRQRGNDDEEGGPPGGRAGVTAFSSSTQQQQQQQQQAITLAAAAAGGQAGGQAGAASGADTKGPAGSFGWIAKAVVSRSAQQQQEQPQFDAFDEPQAAGGAWYYDAGA